MFCQPIAPGWPPTPFPRCSGDDAVIVAATREQERFFSFGTHVDPGAFQASALAYATAAARELGSAT